MCCLETLYVYHYKTWFISKKSETALMYGWLEVWILRYGRPNSLAVLVPLECGQSFISTGFLIFIARSLHISYNSLSGKDYGTPCMSSEGTIRYFFYETQYLDLIKAFVSDRLFRPSIRNYARISVHLL